MYSCALFAVIIGAVGVVGMLGVRSATRTSTRIASDELLTSTVTAQVAQRIDDAYATGERLLLIADPARRADLEGELYSQILPQVETRLAHLQRLHAADPPAEKRDIALMGTQWSKVRDLLRPATLTTGAQPVLADRLTNVYEPLNRHVDKLIDKERSDADAGQARATSKSETTLWVVFAAIVVGFIAAIVLASIGRRRVQTAFEPEQDQVEFGNTLQIADDEAEAHQLLQRHLQRILPTATAVVLNRNNSADRLEAVTPIPAGSSLVAGLAKAEPRSCLAVRSGRTHFESAGRPGLLVCSVCSGCPGNSSCTPLTVGGEVIGSVLLNRAEPFNEVEGQRIGDAVSQSAPVLANLRNLAIAEIRAATDSLTGLPNKRAVTDTLMRMFAQSSRSGNPLSLVLLDLDHFKEVNDRYGHPVGDQALANVGAVLRSVLRAGDFAGRNGGEEFALLLPETDTSAAEEIAQRVGAAIADIALPGVAVELTASLGVATCPDHANTLERLERLADAALYTAKRAGRNRTEVANPGTEPQGTEPPGTEPHTTDATGTVAPTDGTLTDLRR